MYISLLFTYYIRLPEGIFVSIAFVTKRDEDDALTISSSNLTFKWKGMRTTVVGLIM